MYVTNACQKSQTIKLIYMISKLKADRQHPRNYPHTPTDYRHTDEHLRLIMTPIALCCTRQSRAPNIDRCALASRPWPLTLTRDLDPNLWPCPWPLTLKQGNSEAKTRFLAFDLDLWPTTLTYNPSLARVKVDPHTKNQGQRSNGSNRRARTNWQTDGQTDGRYQFYYLPRFAVDK